MHQKGRQYEKKVMPEAGFKPTAYITNNHNNFREVLIFLRAQLNAYIQYTIITMHQSIDVMTICADRRKLGQRSKLN